MGALMQGELPFTTSMISSPWFRYDIVLGVLFIFGFNVGAVSYQLFGIAFTSVMQRMSIILTVAVTIVFFGESAPWLKIIGVLIAISAIYLINQKKDADQQISQKKIYIMVPALVLIFTSIIEIVLFVAEHQEIVGQDQMPFTTHAFGMAGIFGLMFLIPGYVTGRFKFNIKHVTAGIILGLPNYFSIYLITVILAKGMEGSVLFPMLNVSILLLSAVIGSWHFHEKLTRKNWMGIVCSMIAIALIALSTRS